MWNKKVSTVNVHNSGPTLPCTAEIGRVAVGSLPHGVCNAGCSLPLVTHIRYIILQSNPISDNACLDYK